MTRPDPGVGGRVSRAAQDSLASQPRISFGRGVPSTDMLDLDGLRLAATSALDHDAAGVTGYGPPAGYKPLRQWIAGQHGVPADHVLVTNGSLQAQAIVYEALLTAGDTVVVEEPTYDRALTNLRRVGADLVSIPTDQHGLQTTMLEIELRKGLRPALVYVIPNFQNPTGQTLSEPRRRHLIRLSQEYDLIVLEDDPYGDLGWDPAGVPPSLAHLSGYGSGLVYSSSFSKTICPGVRVGYVVGSPELVARLASMAQQTYIAPSMISQAIVHRYCIAGRLGDALPKARETLAERAHAMEETLRVTAPEVTFNRASGGYFLWAHLPEGLDARRVAAAALEQGVEVLPEPVFSVAGRNGAIRLAYSGSPPAEIRRGIERLARAIQLSRTPNQPAQSG